MYRITQVWSSIYVWWDEPGRLTSDLVDEWRVNDPVKREQILRKLQGQLEVPNERIDRWH